MVERDWIIRLVEGFGQANIDDELAETGQSEARFGRDGSWRRPPASWSLPVAIPPMLLERIVREIERLPPAQRAVLVLRDLVGCTVAGAAAYLHTTDTLVIALLHRARTALCFALDRHLGGIE